LLIISLGLRNINFESDNKLVITIDKRQLF
jgi:hypothetical protein